jgi:ABC-type bacteriocin/lantibiotic exporter with double-glycine peptidase domain
MKNHSFNDGVFDNNAYKNHPLRRFFKLLSLDKKDLYRVYVLAIFSGLVSLSLPLSIQGIISQIMAAQFSSSLFVLISLVTVATFFSGIFQILQIKIIEDIQRRIYTRTSFEFAYKIPRLKIESILYEYPPELINRFFDILTIEKGLPKIIIDLSISVVSIVFGLLLLSFYHAFFVFLGFMLLLFVYLLFRYSGERGINTKMKESSYKYKTAHWLQELGRSMVTFKMASKSKIALSNTDKNVSSYLDAREKHFGVLVLQYSTVVAFKTIIITGLLILGAVLVINQELNIGQFVAAEIIVFIVINAVEKLIFSLENVYDVLVGLEKISAVLSMPVEDEAGFDYKDVCDEHKGIDIEITNLRYASFDSKHLALDIQNLNINAGEKVCIMGRNGSGKSTLVHLLSGIYSDYEGEISFNKIPTQNFGVSNLRANIGACFYREDIFSGTIAENITMGNENLNNQMIQVSEKLQLADFVNSLPQGYDTKLLPENRKYPKSVIKKIILARNILKQPKLLILDDLLKQIEKEKRNAITDYITSSENNWTLVLISNDSYTAQKCDRILVLDAGRIIINKPVNEAMNDEMVKSLLE